MCIHLVGGFKCALVSDPIGDPHLTSFDRILCIVDIIDACLQRVKRVKAATSLLPFSCFRSDALWEPVA